MTLGLNPVMNRKEQPGSYGDYLTVRTKRLGDKWLLPETLRAWRSTDTADAANRDDDAIVKPKGLVDAWHEDWVGVKQGKAVINGDGELEIPLDNATQAAATQVWGVH